ncbi:peroxiredoxin [bacterium]|nr:peroxiredoxin [bacterium]
MPNVGEKAPDFCLPNQDDKEVCMKEYKGSWLVLYFYPKDNTSGCTLEAQEFTTNLNDFKGLNAQIIGISPDSPKSHRNFIEKYDLKITLLSDPEHDALEKFGAWKLKKNYGREYMGVQRSTYLINPDGEIAAAWQNVRVKGHVDAVRMKLEELKG